MQSSETWIIQSVPVHVSSSITPRHHFFRLLGPWGENTQLLAQLPQLPRWPFRTALMQITSPDCLLRSLVSQTLRDEKDWMELSEIWQEFHLLFFVFGKVTKMGRKGYLYLLYFRICHNTRKWDLCRSTSPRCSRLQLGGASRRNGIFALPVVATLHIN